MARHEREPLTAEQVEAATATAFQLHSASLEVLMLVGKPMTEQLARKLAEHLAYSAQRVRETPRTAIGGMTQGCVQIAETVFTEEARARFDEEDRADAQSGDK